MSNEFHIAAEWSSLPERDQRDVAAIRISAGSAILTRVLDLERREEREAFRASAVSLAFWLGDNWWRLRHESLPNSGPPSVNWRLRHEMTSASGGSLWPPVMIHSTGDRILLAPVFGRSVEKGALRYLFDDLQVVSATDFEKGLDGFFDQVIGACSMAADGAALAALVKDLKAERQDPETAAWRRLEARLGYDPDTIPDMIMKVFGRLESFVGGDTLEEAAAAAPGSDSGEVLNRAVEAVKCSQIAVDFEIANDVSRSPMRDQVAPPWRLGRDAAYRVRQAANLKDGPLRQNDFADLFRTSKEELTKPGTARHLPYGVRSQAKNSRQKIALKSANVRDRRFELSCLLGDQVWAHSDFGISSSAKTDRQKFQRAFAQEFLAPYADVRRLIDESDPTPRQIETAATHFHVHANVIRRRLIIEGILPEETLEERLEAA